MASLELVVVVLDSGSEFDLFDLNVVLLLPGLPGRTSLFVLELPVVHHLDHRGPSVGCNLNQVQPLFFSALSGFVDADDANLLAVVGNQTYGADPDLVVDSDLWFFDGSEPPLLVSLGSLPGPILTEQKRPGSTGPERNQKSH